MTSEPIRIINGKTDVDRFLQKSEVILVAYIDYKKDKRLYRPGTKLYDYLGTVVYPKILGTVPSGETVKDFVDKNKELIYQYEIVFLDVYQNPERVSFQDLIFEGMLK